MPRTTTAPRKPARAARGTQQANGRQRASSGRERASSRSTRKAPNKFDAVAAAAAAGDDDLARQLSASIGQPKGKDKPTPNGQDAAVPKDKPKASATGGAVAFKGRPTSNPETIAARVNEAGIRVRKDTDPADLATRLRATVPAVTAWLASRNGNGQPAKQQQPKQPSRSTTKATTTKQPAKAKAQPKQPKPVHVDVGHAWEGAVPKNMPELRGATLVFRYELRPDGEVWSALLAIRDANGDHLEDGWRLPLDFRWQQERDGRNRPVKLQGQAIDRSTLTAWLATQGLITE